MNRQLKKLQTAQSKYESSIGEVESQLKDSVGFDFSIFHQPGDGWVMLNYEYSSNSPLFTCLQVIKEKGVLSDEDHERLSI